MCNAKITSYEDRGEKARKNPNQLTKKYNSGWEHYKEFKDWLAPSKKGVRCFYCSLCRCDYDGGIIAVKQHSLSKKHNEKLGVLINPVKKHPAEVIELTERNFNEVAGSCEGILVMFCYRLDTRFWKQFEYIAEQLAEEFQGRMLVGRIEPFDCRRLAYRFDTFGSPVFMFYRYKKEAIFHNRAYNIDNILDFARSEMKPISKQR